MIKQKAIKVCDYCKKEIEKNYIKTTDVPNEGCSTIILMVNNREKESFEIGDQDYCNIVCLFNHIKNTLKED